MHILCKIKTKATQLLIIQRQTAFLFYTSLKMLVQKQLEFRHVLYTFIKLKCKIRWLTFNFKAKKTSTLLLHSKSIILIFLPVLNIYKTDRGILVALCKTTMLTCCRYCLNFQLTHSSPPTLKCKNTHTPNQ